MAKFPTVFHKTILANLIMSDIIGLTCYKSDGSLKDTFRAPIKIERKGNMFLSRGGRGMSRSSTKIFL